MLALSKKQMCYLRILLDDNNLGICWKIESDMLDINYPDVINLFIF